MNTTKLIIAIALISVITLSTRAFPFLLFGRSEKPSPNLIYIGKYLPPAIICAIIVYSFKNTNIFDNSHALPEIISVICVVFLQLKFKNTMLSIFLGTIIYMCFVQFIFA